MVAAIRFFRSREAGELAHGPELAAIHVAMNAAGIGKLTWRGKFTGRRRLVERLHFDTTDGGEAAFREPSFTHLCLQFSSYRRSAFSEAADAERTGWKLSA